ncbi:MAG: hypothetical protein AB1330_01770 [Bacillota bacterium]
MEQERSVVLVVIKDGRVHLVQSTDAEALIAVHYEDTDVTDYFEWPEVQWGDELDQVLEEYSEDSENENE